MLVICQMNVSDLRQYYLIVFSCFFMWLLFNVTANKVEYKTIKLGVSGLSVPKTMNIELKVCQVISPTTTITQDDHRRHPKHIHRHHDHHYHNPPPLLVVYPASFWSNEEFQK